MKISLFAPCFVDQFFPHVAMSVVEVLERLGHDVDVPRGLTCCGQPAFNSGYHDEAKLVAKHTLRELEHCDLVVLPSGSCTTMLRVFYPEMFADSTHADLAKRVADKSFEFSELLVDQLSVTDVGARLTGRATFHDGCHGLRELRIQSAPRQLLEQVEGLELVEMKEAQSCCGFGGTFAVKFPQISTAMVEVKADSIAEAAADIVVSNDPSCLMQIQGYLSRNKRPTRCLHLAEVLASR